MTNETPDNNPTVQKIMDSASTAVAMYPDVLRRFAQKIAPTVALLETKSIPIELAASMAHGWTLTMLAKLSPDNNLIVRMPYDSQTLEVREKGGMHVHEARTPEGLLRYTQAKLEKLAL